MDIEKEIFKKTNVNFKLLEDYGFKKEQNVYKYSKNFMSNNFRADMLIDKVGNITGIVVDLLAGEEYSNFRIEKNYGIFVNHVKEEYIAILEDIRENCFEKEYFIFPQTNRITKHIIDKYKNKPEFLWKNHDGYGVFRNYRGKWNSTIKIN